MLAHEQKLKLQRTGFLISVGLALGVRVGIQKLGSLGLFPLPPAPLLSLALEITLLRLASPPVG